MRFALYYLAKLKQENAELEVQVRALENVWTVETVTRGASWLRLRIANLTPPVT
jgi:hypothetical protein